MKINFPTHICLARNYQLCLILTHWINSKCKDVLQVFNVYKILAKEHEVVDGGVGDEISVS